MKRLLLVYLILVMFILAACELPSTVTPTKPGDPTGTATETPEPSATELPDTPTPTITPIATPVDPYNELENPGFEGNYRPVIFGEVNVAPDWESFYCDEPYMSEKCEALRQGDGNPFGLMMGRPEFKPISTYIYPELVYEGELAQTWFCFWRTCNAGVYQTFETIEGETYKVGAIVRSWFNYDDDVESDLETADDWAGSVWWIGIDTNSDAGIKSAFDESLAVCEFEVNADGPAEENFYDNWVEISCEFVAEGDTATVFFGNLRTWPIVNNDNYIGWAYAYQLTGLLPYQLTPTPRATQGPTPTADPDVTPTPEPATGMYYPYSSQNVRNDHGLTGLVVAGLVAGSGVEFYAIWESEDSSEIWLAVNKEGSQWAAYMLNEATYGVVVYDE